MKIPLMKITLYGGLSPDPEHTHHPARFHFFSAGSHLRAPHHEPPHAKNLAPRAAKRLMLPRERRLPIGKGVVITR